MQSAYSGTVYQAGRYNGTSQISEIFQLICDTYEVYSRSLVNNIIVYQFLNQIMNCTKPHYIFMDVKYGTTCQTITDRSTRVCVCLCVCVCVCACSHVWACVCLCVGA